MVDLIPEEYRRAVRVRRLIGRFGWSCCAIVAAVAAASGGLAYAIGQERAALARYKQLQAQSRAQQARLTEVMARRDNAQRQLQVLESLRGDASIAAIIGAVDAALDDRIWFQELTFSRAGEAAERKAEAGEAGYFIVAAKDKRGDARPEGGAWRARERAEIRGLARDHAALAEFIKRLGGQPEVKQVKLLDTSARSYPGVQVVSFQLAALLGAASGAAQ
jgi:Tfp pilus assembly protein PilN